MNNYIENEFGSYRAWREGLTESECDSIAADVNARIEVLKRGFRESIGADPHLVETLIAYVVHGRPTGDFCEAMIANDLRDCVMRADHINAQNLTRNAGAFFWNAPLACFGSRDKYSEWVSKGGLLGAMREFTLSNRKLSAVK